MNFFLVLAIIASLGFAQSPDYSKPGPHAYSTTSTIRYRMPSSTGCDADRNYCNVDIEVTYPKTSGAFPLAIYSNGFAVGMRKYKTYSDRFASWGYTTIRWNPDEGALAGVTQHSRGKIAAELVKWAFDQTKNPSSPIYGKVDASKGVVQSGHSLGGKTSLLGAIYNPSVVGMVLMDPVDCPPPMPPGLPYDDDNPNAIAMMGQTKASGVFIGAELGDIGELIPCAPTKCNYQKYYSNATSPAWEVKVMGAGHSQWVDGTGSGGDGGCSSGPAQTSIVQSMSYTIMIAWAEKTVYKKDISYWTSIWIEEMKKLGRVDYKLK